MYLPSNFVYKRSVEVQVVKTYNSAYTSTAKKNSVLILSEIRFLCGLIGFTNVYIGITFSRWDIANEIFHLNRIWHHHTKKGSIIRMEMSE